ncbi:BTAD domain-containing putative transcriptional regulator, partial [Nocardia gipuzkoensis]
ERWHELLMVALYRSGLRAEALEAYRHARRVLADELGLEPGPGILRLRRRLLSAEPSARSDPRPAHVPRWLPPDPADFVGREDRMSELTAALADGDRGPTIAITGMGGVGKTALAVHLAHRERARYPDGLLYLDLGGTDARPRTPQMLLAAALRSIGVHPGDLPSEPHERVSLWRNAVAGRRMLLILDNARDVDQLVSLLPGDGAVAVLITSRSSLAELFGARLFPLDVL